MACQRFLKLLFCVVLLVTGYELLVTNSYAQETLTITTYYPSPFGSYRDLTVSRRTQMGSTSATWINDAITGFTDGFEASDGALFVPVFSAAGDSDLRLYILDDAADRFSIWGDTCGGGSCGNLNNASNVATFMGSGNVGIGTTGPSRRLEIVDASNGAFPLSLYRTGNGIDWGVVLEFALQDSVNARKVYADIYGAITTNTAGAENGFLQFRTKKAGTLTNQVRITKDGNVGIGTTTPGNLLHLYGTNASTAGPHIRVTTSADTTYPIFQQLNWAHNNISLNLDSYYDGSWRSAAAGSNYQIYKVGDLLRFRYATGVAAGGVVSWNDGIVLNTAGNVGIGTAGPLFRLVADHANKAIVAARNTPYGGLMSGSTNGIGLFATNLYIDGGTYRTAGTHGSGYGYAGVSATWGNLYFYAQPGNTVADAAVAPVARITVRGSDGAVSIGNLGLNTYVYSNGTYLTNTFPSSRAYKKDIEDVKLNAENLLKLEPKSFIWKENGKKDFGYIAEDVWGVLPELREDDGVTKGYDVAKLPIYIIELLKKQQKQIDALESRIDSLKSKIN